RYSRHFLLPEVGEAGQQKTANAKVFVLGAGGLGAPALYYLAAAGVGTLGICDFDAVEASNLQRQIIHSTARVGVNKAKSARMTIEELNPDVDVQIYEERLTASNVDEIVGGYDIIIDATDNFATRYLLNDAAVRLGKPYVYGSIFRFEGYASVFWPAQGGPCYRCLFREAPPAHLAPSCSEAGVLGVLPGIIGVIQANEVLKIIVGYGEPLVGKQLVFDATGTHFDEFRIRRDPDCPTCGVHRDEAISALGGVSC
ncbi:MAG: molybdopterin-synthase adenylyltransferase MoeB, partial [Actinomycetota bacterium]